MKLGSDVIDVLMAGILGAVLLALVLLWQGYRANRKVIRQLQADIADQKRAGLSSRAGPSLRAAPRASTPQRKPRIRLSLLRGGRLATRFRLAAASVRRTSGRRHVATAAPTITSVAAVSADTAFTRAPQVAPSPTSSTSASQTPEGPSSEPAIELEPTGEQDTAEMSEPFGDEHPAGEAIDDTEAPASERHLHIAH